jgi:agmatinase
MRTLTRLAQLTADDVVLLGVPWDEQSSFMRGASVAPDVIRRAIFSLSSNPSTELGLDLGRDERFLDAGNLRLPEGETALDAITQGAAEILTTGALLLALGGDHAVTFPLVRAHATHWPGLNVLHLDAHPDLYEEFEGNRYSHACPFARILEEGLASRLVQVGIRTLNDPQRSQVSRFNVEQVEVGKWANSNLTFDGPVYLSLDLDVLDPAFAPGVSHHEPGGLSVRDVLRIIHGFRGRLVGADVVELNPLRDPTGVTGMVAAKLVKEIAGRMLST